MKMSVIYLVIGWILTATAITGNFLVIFLIVITKRLQTTANSFVLSLAVADFCSRFFSFHSRISATQCLFVMIAYVGFYRGNLP